MAPPNWDTFEQIRSHKLVTSIINGHLDEEMEVLGPSELVLLQRYVADPTSREAIMTETGWIDGKQGSGSLVGYLVSKQETEDPALDERDIEMLREWFARDMPVGENVVR